jgi:uncharacterized Zn-binding protein involved in type VI secretion
MHVCPMFNGPVPHVGGPIIKGEFTVFTGKLPQARLSDMCVCVGPPDVIVKGSAGVMVGKLPAARIGDMTAHGGAIVLGCFTVFIGETGGGGGGGGGGGAGAGGGGSSGYTGGSASLIPVEQSGMAAPQTSTTGEGGQPFVEIAYASAEQQADSLRAAGETGAPFVEICFGG